MPTCPSCNQQVPEGKKFCRHCGASLAVHLPPGHAKCNECGKVQPVGKKFCRYCGSPTKVEASPVNEGISHHRSRSTPERHVNTLEKAFEALRVPLGDVKEEREASSQSEIALSSRLPLTSSTAPESIDASEEQEKMPSAQQVGAAVQSALLLVSPDEPQPHALADSANAEAQPGLHGKPPARKAWMIGAAAGIVVILVASAYFLMTGHQATTGISDSKSAISRQPSPVAPSVPTDAVKNKTVAGRATDLSTALPASTPEGEESSQSAEVRRVPATREDLAGKSAVDPAEERNQMDLQQKELDLQRQRQELELQRQKQELELQRERQALESLRQRQLETQQQASRQQQSELEDQKKEQKKEVEDVRPRYTGPSSGTLVWEGEIRGVQLVEIENARSSVGSVSGKLPGVPCLVQPSDPKKVSIAVAPGPSNGWNRIVLRVQGNGRVVIRLNWALI